MHKASNDLIPQGRHYPPKVYLSGPSRFVALGLTIPSPAIPIPLNPASQAEKEFSVVLSNPGRYFVCRPDNAELVRRMKYAISDEVIKILLDTGDKLNSLTRQQLQEILRSLATPSNKPIVEQILERIVESENTLNQTDSGALPVIEGFIFQGEFIPWDQRELLAPKAAELFSMFEVLCPAAKGAYLYRAVTHSEWNQIVRDGGYYCVYDQTNFETDIESQVQHYSQADDYAGKIVRIRVSGPYFRAAGTSVPRVTSTMPHYARVEVLQGDQWVSAV